ncbi:MAG: hypothetical protein ACRDM9_05275, partial [Gaiellaceae bacterium]
LEAAILRSGRRLALGATSAAALVATGITAASDTAAGWIPGTLGAVAGGFAAWLAVELVRRR